jgi:hypothetical protein
MTDSVNHFEALDKILEYLVNRKGQSISYRQIKTDVFPKMGINEFVTLANQIVDTNTALSNIQGKKTEGYGDWPNEGEITATDLTEVFLKQGGFKKHVADQQKRSADETLAKQLDMKFKQKSLTKLKYDRVTFWIASTTAICGLVFGTITFLEKGKLEKSIEKLQKQVHELMQDSQIQKALLQKQDTTISNR